MIKQNSFAQRSTVDPSTRTLISPIFTQLMSKWLMQNMLKEKQPQKA